MLDNLKKYDIILASQSPRRQELLKGLDIPFSVNVIKDIDESFPSDLTGADIPLFISKKKAEAYHAIMKKNSMIITADTIVWCDNQVLGKPKTIDEAKKMLQLLSEKTHTVYTGVCVHTIQHTIHFSAASKVRFAALTDEEIDYYLSRYKPLDKAGSYGVQEWIGYIAVEYIEGSYYNIMGLPIQRLYTELKKF